MSPTLTPFAAVKDGVRVTVRVTPGASRTAIAGLAETVGGGRALKVTVTVAPEAGKANEAVIKLLARTWGVAKTSLTLIAGHGDRNKIIHVSGDPPDLMSRLVCHLPKEPRP